MRVLVLTGEGRGFCPGADLGHFTEGGADEVLEAEHFQVVTLLHEMPAVTVAAVNGACAGAGMGWAVACDLRLMAASAKMNTAFLDVAVAGDMALPWFLPRLVGAVQAQSCRSSRAGSPPRRRCASDSSPGSSPTTRSGPRSRTSSRPCWPSRPPRCEASSSTTSTPSACRWPSSCSYESERHLEIAASADTAEAFRAFMEKRPPRFTTS